MKALETAGDVCLFVLGDEGVLFSETRQELYTLNTSATLLWCLLEEGASLDSLVDAYARTFGLTGPAAEQHVYPILRRWFGLGHLSDPAVPGAGQMPLSEALACLLTNARLRARFREAPDDVGAALGVVEEDRRALLMLDPDALDCQADEITEHRSLKRQGVPAGVVSLDATELLAAAASVPWQTDTMQRFYRVLDTTFQVTISPALAARVHAVLLHLAVDAGPADVLLHVRESNGGCVIFDGLVPVAWHETPAGLVPSLKILLRRFAVARHRYFMEIHAGVVRLGEDVLLLPGSAGHGKTTLTAALVHSQGVYFSDEIALLEENSLGVCPMPLAMTIKPGSVDPLLDLYPGVGTLDEHLREDHQPVRYLPPPRDRWEREQTARPAKWVVFPHYERGAETVAVELSAAQGLKRLLDESLVLPALLDRRNVAMLVSWARQLAFYDLRLSSLDAGVQAIRGIANGE